MNKTEFLDQLRVSLNGKIEADEVTDNLRYYEDYINGQLRLGRTENEVITSLGSPRLIARTIADALKEKQRYVDMADEDAGWQQAESQAGWRQTESQAGWRQFGRGTEEQGDFRTSAGMPWIAKFLTLPRWLKTTISVAILILVVAIFVAILQFLLPVIILAAFALFLVKLFRDWLH
ncbi:MAG: DUF1700 domain-containing protein [Lachnospiraceae bacterium]|nr:DUF1700 domain-containing protein [Lachnospiraceae bacterium]